MTRIKCKGCSEYIKKADQDDAQTDRNGEQWHYECYEAEIERLSTSVHFQPDGEVIQIRFNNNFVVNDGGDDPCLPDPVKAEKWVSTDAWRGYTDWDLNKGYLEVSEGWVTGYPDETTSRKADLADLYEDLKEGRIVPPCDIWWLFGTTSNIFSSSSSIVIRSGDLELLNAWLEEIGTSLDKIDEQLA